MDFSGNTLGGIRANIVGNLRGEGLTTRNPALSWVGGLGQKPENPPEKINKAKTPYKQGKNPNKSATKRGGADIWCRAKRTQGPTIDN